MVERRAFLVGSAALVASACTPADRSAAPASTGSASAADWAELQKLLGERFIPRRAPSQEMLGTSPSPLRWVIRGTGGFCPAA